MDKREIPDYDVEALKRNIIRLKLDIATFEAIVEKSRAQNRVEQIKIFTEAIEKAEKEKAELEEYIALIEGARSGH